MKVAVSAPDHFVAPYIMEMLGDSAVPITAEAMDHHPEWSNVYNKVEIYLVTHSEGGITQLDIDLAREIDSHFSAFKL